MNITVNKSAYNLLVNKNQTNLTIAPFDVGVGAIPANTCTTKGDIIVATGSGVYTRIAATTAGRVLTAQGTGVYPEYILPDGEAITSITLRVKPGGGGDYTTIQEAINYFKGKTVYGLNYIYIDAGTYDELLTIDGINLVGKLHLYGDYNRNIVAVPYINEGIVGYTVTSGGVGTVALSRSGSPYKVLTVTCGTTAVDFDAAGVVAGDTVISYTGVTADTFTENVLTGASNDTLTGTNAWDSAVGTAGQASTIMIKPNVIINPTTSSGTVISVNNVGGQVIIDGFYIKPKTTGDNCVYIYACNYITLNNLILYSGAYGIYASGNSTLSSGTSAITATNCACGILVTQNSVFSAYYPTTVKCPTGFQSVYGGQMEIDYSKVIKSSTVGWLATQNGFITATSQYAVGNTADHSPTKNNVGNNNSFVTAT